MQAQKESPAPEATGDGADASGRLGVDYSTGAPALKPDLSEARRLLEAGMTLVKLHEYKKQPIGENWNKRAAKEIDAEATGYGLPLVPNGLASIDPDHYEMARVGVAAWGFNLDDLLDQGVRTESTRPNSGGRAAFRADEHETARWLSFVVFDSEGNGTTVLELRDKSKNLQDVVPGVVYADKDTGEIYTQRYANGKRFDDAPELPDDFARFWRAMSIDDDELRARQLEFVQAIIDAGFLVNETRPQYRPAMGSGRKLAFAAPGIRSQYNNKNDVEGVLERHGYRYHRSLRRWSHPGATGAPGIRVIPGKDDLWHSDHGGDPLHGTFDAWGAHVQLDHGGDVEAAIAEWQREEVAADFEATQKAETAEPHINPDDLLPGHPEALLNLPHGLGKIQDWIHGRMKYPSRATAGVGALATLTAFTQSHITVDSFGGLGLNEQYLVLAPTGFGKEDLRAPISVLAEASALDVLFDGNRSEIQWSPPSSLQGMHKLLEENPAQMFLSDEFAEWLAQTSSDAHKQAALGYFMQLYTKALSTVNAPHAVTNTYSPVKNPRVSVLATSTAERILESMTLSHADSGAYNRWLILLAEQDRIPKRYTGLQYEPPEDVVELVRKVGCYPETRVTFSSEAWAHFVEHDSHVIEPLKFDDNHLAGRLSEQAIKIAALVALSDSRTEINVQDLRTAYAIREGLYHRVRAMVSHEGGFTGMHATGQALEQLRDVLTRKEFVYKSRLPALSRKYKGLSLPERQAVLAALYDAGEIEDVKDRKGLIQCNVSAGG